MRAARGAYAPGGPLSRHEYTIDALVIQSLVKKRVF